MIDGEVWHIEDVKLTAAKTNLLKLMTALITCNATLNDSYIFGSRNHEEWNRNDSLTVSVTIPKINKEKFEKITGWELIKPPVITVN